MSNRLTWSPLRSLDDRRGIPKGSGIYLIGVADPSLLDLGDDSEYYGKNYPHSFRPRYVGMTMSPTYGIASRIRSHALKRGNKQIKSFILQEGIQNLFYTYCELDDADFAEVAFLHCIDRDFLDWNNKNELLGAAKRFALEHGPPAPILIDSWEPEEQIAEIQSKRELAKNWQKLLDDNPKYKRMIKNRQG